MLTPAYEPGTHEKKTYDLWEKSGAFTPKKAAHTDSFTIMMPLPNANGRLHIGHVLFITLQDLIIRYQRMKGKAALWLPGADHAGFETWVVYEKQLEKQGKSRFDYSREELYGQVWDFVVSFRKEFEDQFRELGASVDWSRFTFSLDDKIVKQVYTTFKQLWDDDLVYRGERIVNFCTFHGTSFADIEVEYKDEKSHLYHIAYPLTDGSGEVVVATTRPETMLGDTAVAVNPKDSRYAKLVGKTVMLPLTNRLVPIIADDFVDIKFGSGAVKLTPAHDPNDFEAAKRHDLPMITVIDHEGKMTAEVPAEYRDLPAEEARHKVLADLKEQGFLKKTEAYTHSVGHCYKCGRVIQPLLREQWFIDMQPLAARTITVLKNNEINFYPKTKQTQLIGYLEGLRDWNISRQIAWGIPIPAFQNVDNPDDWIFDERVEQEEVKVEGKTYRRDPDVFDTWFSSGQWPFATLGLGSDDFRQFYPTNLMETGGEILYPWVSRMLMLGLYVTDQIPFYDVYIHGYVLAEDGAKMSKSLGNVVDPAAMRQKYGTDALRLGLIDGRAPAINRPFDETKVVAGRNFANKLWNIARFAQNSLKSDLKTVVKPEPKTAADHWILNKLSISIKNISGDLESYKFAESYAALYEFVWNDLADWYVEASKVAGNPSVLSYVLEQTLKLAHPFAPFVTETIWQQLKLGEQNLIISAWPKPVEADKAAAKQFEQIKQLVSEIRRVNGLLESKATTLYLSKAGALESQAKYVELIQKLSGLKKVEQGTPTGLRLVNSPVEAWLDTDASKYAKQLQKQLEEREAEAKLLEQRLANKGYLAKAPKKLIEQTKQQLAETEAAARALAQEQKSIV